MVLKATSEISLPLDEIPVIDLFAGPGGLGEGFSGFTDDLGNQCFRIGLSIEKDPVAHRTLELRSFFRKFRENDVPSLYYDYLKGKVTRNDLFSCKKFQYESDAARQEAFLAELGKTDSEIIGERINTALDGRSNWVLIGGPPCQAYSLVGRSRMKNSLPAFETDRRHTLYEEYLKILRDHSPPVFVMENVKGILSSTHKEQLIFKKILNDLSRPSKDLSYRILPLAYPADENVADPEKYIVRSEKYGVPQARHRVILLGIRDDIRTVPPTLDTRPSISVWEAISDLPRLRSRISKGKDSFDGWMSIIKECIGQLRKQDEFPPELTYLMEVEYEKIGNNVIQGGQFSAWSIPEPGTPLNYWFHDRRLGGVLNHESRSHQPEDIKRYFFSSCFAKYRKTSPKLKDFPKFLLPDHKNIRDDGNESPFADRFRVQIHDRPSKTVVSHISKDGHYFIHPDPTQCRSLTVREAARLQTFPDNYFFEGNRTEQYRQVGNAVPPFLAFQIAGIVRSILMGGNEQMLSLP